MVVVRSSPVAARNDVSCQTCGTMRSPGGKENSKCTRIGGANLFGMFTCPHDLDEICCICAKRNGWISEECTGCKIRSQAATLESSSEGNFWDTLLNKAGDLTARHLSRVAEDAAKRERLRLERSGESGIYVGLLNLAEGAARNVREYQERQVSLVRWKCQECYCEFDSSKGISCARKDRHFLCHRCFGREVREQVSQIRFAARGGKVICPLCLPNTTTYTDGALARGLSDADFALYCRAESEVAAELAAHRRHANVGVGPTGAADVNAHEQQAADVNAHEQPDAAECYVCFADVSDGVHCPSPARHMVCRGCFSREVHEQLAPEMQGRFCAAGARVVCRACLPAAVAYTDGALARALSDTDFALYRRAVVEDGATRVRREEEARLQQAVAALRAELQAAGGGRGGGGAGDRVRRHRLRIAEEVLCLRCPRCGQAFVDFEGCFALTCGRCACAFCAYCLADCGADAHPHVAACAHNAAPGRGLYGDAALFREAQNARRARALREYLRDSVDPADRSAVRAAIDADLAGLGMD